MPQFLSEKCTRLTVSYAPNDDTLHTYGVSFRSDGRREKKITNINQQQVR